MKEILNFVQWQWKKFELWQKCFIVGGAFLGSSVVAPEPWNYWLAIVPMIMVFSFTFKWWMWDGTVASWKAYKEEKNNLLTKIKQSDQKLS